MKLHNVPQGGPEWHALRNRVKHTASDLAAIRGHSKYKTRAQAVREAATGIKPEVSEFQQRKFDEGHATEALARAILEKRIGEDLYPATATTDDEYLLASSDGATMIGTDGFEHKLLNADVVAQIKAGKLDPMYTDQMDQQAVVFGFERIFFVCSDGTEDNFHVCEYYPPNLEELEKQIRADWEQFDKDVAAYVPEVAEAKPILTAAPIDHLPALVIEVTGRVMHSNLVEFKAAANAVISSIKTELVTDQDFVDAKAQVKYLVDVKDNANRAKKNALDQTAGIAELHRALDDVITMADNVRKTLEKQIDESNRAQKEEIVSKPRRELAEYVSALNKRIGGLMPSLSVDFASVVKGMRSLDSMRDKVSVALANAKIEANAIADRIDSNIKSLEGEGHSWRFLFPDLAAVCTKAHDDFAALLAARIAAHKEAEAKHLEVERERIRQEEVARINAEQAEAAAKAQREAEEQARQNALATASNQQQIAAAVQEASVTGLGVVQVVANEDGGAVAKHIPADAVVSSINDCLPTIKLGDICARLGISVTADFLASLGIEPIRVEKSAKLYDANKFPTICRLIADHIMAQAFKKAA